MQRPWVRGGGEHMTQKRNKKKSVASREKACALVPRISLKGCISALPHPPSATHPPQEPLSVTHQPPWDWGPEIFSPCWENGNGAGGTLLYTLPAGSRFRSPRSGLAVNPVKDRPGPSSTQKRKTAPDAYQTFKRRQVRPFGPLPDPMFM